MKGYEIVGFERIQVTRLEPHQEAVLPMDEEDSAALQRSVSEDGLLAPLIVEAKPSKAGVRRILDGVNRWNIARALEPQSSVPCVLVETASPREVALIFLGTGRKRSTGQRVMAFLELHREKVLQVAEIVGDEQLRPGLERDHAGHVTGLGIPRNLQDFTCEAMAARLGVSDKDIRLGVDLLKTVSAPHDSPKEAAAAEATFAKVLAGTTPIRRWKSAVAGKKAEQRGRNDTNYAELLYRGVRHLESAFRHWKAIPAARRAEAEEFWRKCVVPIFPEQMK
jgi:hypothetical protein